MDGLPRNLVLELERQVFEIESREVDSSEEREVIEGVFTLKTQGDDYSRNLRLLRASILNCNPGTRDWTRLSLPEKSLLWKVPAFCRPSSRLSDPSYARRKLDAFLNVVGSLGLSSKTGSDTESLWQNKLIEQWITSGKPSSISLEIPFASAARVRRFGLELIDHLEKYQPVLHILGGFPPSEAKSLLTLLQPEVVLRQLAIQALQQVKIDQPLSFLVHNLDSFKTAKTSQDWFDLLRKICCNIPKLTIILDLSVIDPKFVDQVRSWPAEFEQLTAKLWESSSPSFFQVMLLGPSHMFAESHNQGPLVSIGSLLGPNQSWLPYRSPTRPEPRALEPPNSGEDPGVVSMGTNQESSGDIIQDTQTVNLAACSTNSSENAAHDQKPESVLQNPKEATEQLTESTFSRKEVRIVIVCALPLEADAVCALFDKPCDADLSEMKAPGDTNAYTFGIIGRHPTVVVHMPGMGKTNGAITATKCQSSFPNVKLALVVGICGGVPFYDKGRKEIILGDVIISEGLIAYDFGRRFPDSFVAKNSPRDAFARPPVEVRSLLNKLKCRADLRRFRERTCEHLAILRQSPDCQAVYPGATEDQLFEGTYVHRHNNPDACHKCSNPANVSNSVCDQARSSSCEELSCDKAKLVPRRRLEDIMRSTSVSVPAVHFGYIACGDQVMKSGEHRNRIAEENGVIAFEMEGAGVWDTFPCLVIKAVCDYADSHKHKKWQDYAAATAAACAKAFLQEWHI